MTKEKRKLEHRAKERRRRRIKAGFSEMDALSLQESTALRTIVNCVDTIRRCFRELGRIEAKRFAISQRNVTRTELSGQNYGLFK